MSSEKMINEQWAAISKDVAVMLWGQPNQRLSRGDKLRWGTRGSKSLDARKGLWKDFETDQGGGVLDLVETERQTDRAGAIQWLKDNGFIGNRKSIRRFVGSTSPQPARWSDRAKRPPKSEKQTEPSGETDKAQRLWTESEPILDFVFEHPAWRWVTVGDKTGIVEPGATMPGCIRWHKQQGLIVAGRNTFDAWIKGEFEPFSVSVVAIDRQGKKRWVFHNGPGGDKRTFGSGADGVFIGDPQSPKVGICEGVADALAVYNVFGVDAVWATNSAIVSVQNVLGGCEWLAGREVVLYTDADEGGQEAGDKVKSEILRRSPKVWPQVVCEYPFGAKDAAECAAYQSTWAYEVDEKSGMLMDSGLPVEKADRLALQHVIRRYQND
ncbi:MAG: hypothetical protein F4Y39_08620 [Gemmatimonadetes bacterium]|nr:hypothetical protein [Gemmatimonadota bacterium]MYK51691.1 hypothetical protein [Gemmatimonadota bacterium]